MAQYGAPAGMNAMEKTVRTVDRFQQRHKPLAVLYGVIKKYGDDNAGVLVGSLANTAFGSVFPLLLLLVTILGIVLADHSALRHEVLDSTLKNFPIIGNDLSRNIKTLHRDSAIGLIVGILGLVWGSMGLAQNGIFTMEQVWNLPGPDRLNYVKRLGRSVAFLVVLGLGMCVSTFLAAAAPTANGSFNLTVLGGLGSAIVNFGEYLFAFRVLTPALVRLRQLVPGALVGGIAWTVLQSVGGFVVGHYLKNDSAVYGLFAIVLGLFAWIYLIVELTVYAAELNVVLARHLWPRSIVQPPLTDADRRSLSAQALQNRRRPEQRVDVTFEDDPKAYGDSDQPVDLVTDREVDVTAPRAPRERTPAPAERASTSSTAPPAAEEGSGGKTPEASEEVGTGARRGRGRHGLRA